MAKTKFSRDATTAGSEVTPMRVIEQRQKQSRSSLSGSEGNKRGALRAIVARTPWPDTSANRKVVRATKTRP